MSLRLHINCGDVYLTPAEGWVNVDQVGKGVYLARDKLDIVQRDITIDADYYGRRRDVTIASLRSGPRVTESTCDHFGSPEKLPFQIGEADEILIRRGFESLSKVEVEHALDEMDRVLTLNGVLRIDVPDHDMSIQRYREVGDEFWRRHMFGPKRGVRSCHVTTYTRESLRGLVEDYGFVFEAEESPIHLYPAFTLRWRKPPILQARDYILRGILIAPSARVLEVGPGQYPLSRASMYCDNDPNVAQRVSQETGKECRIGDLCKGLPIESKSWDWVICSHVLEHCTDPLAACVELSRIAHAGVIAVPHAFTDSMFLFESRDHRWWCFPPNRDLTTIGFMRADDKKIGYMVDRGVQSMLCRLFRSGPNRFDSDSRTARKWFAETNDAGKFDIIIAWQDKVGARIIEW